jgi:hypothetical protein
MKYRDLAETGVRWGPGGYPCRCCRPGYTKAGLHRKLRRFEKNQLRKEAK